jgi:hypothetical protein
MSGDNWLPVQISLIALGAGPDFFLHGVVNSLEIFSPQQLDNFPRAEVVVMCGRTGSRAYTAIQAAVEFVIKADVRLDILKYFFQCLPAQFRAVGYRVADVFLYSA